MLWAINIIEYVDGTHKADVGLSHDEKPYVNLITKFVAAIILHVTMQPKVNEAIQRLIYIRRHPHKFQNILIPIIISYMKLIVEFSTELICLIITSTYNNSIEVVMNYIALGVISELDEVYYRTIRAPIKDQLEDRNFELPISNHEGGIFHKGLGPCSKLLLSLTGLIEYMYQVFYFHFFPMTIYLFILQVYGQGDSTVKIKEWKENHNY